LESDLNEVNGGKCVELQRDQTKNDTKLGTICVLYYTSGHKLLTTLIFTKQIMDIGS